MKSLPKQSSKDVWQRSLNKKLTSAALQFEILIDFEDAEKIVELRKKKKVNLPPLFNLIHSVTIPEQFLKLA